MASNLVSILQARFLEHFPPDERGKPLASHCLLFEVADRISDTYGQAHGRGSSVDDDLTAEMCIHLLAALNVLYERLKMVFAAGDLGALERVQVDGPVWDHVHAPEGWRLGVHIGEMQAAARAMGVSRDDAEDDIKRMVPEAAGECFWPVVCAV